tara:strand:- start:239 stop:574 length:336 start_codon:yes stop_codon:yes gene_type:complete
MSYKLTFRARDGRYGEGLDYDEPAKWFEGKYDSVQEAEAVIQNLDHIKWKWEEDDDEEQWVTLDFQREPKIENKEGEVVSICFYERRDPDEEPDYDLWWGKTKYYDGPDID